ncbi:MAG: biotin transporter BioY [Planctomycetes bacterium]|nr:biotin transporter BioY [Planctomycetota bacterium]
MFRDLLPPFWHGAIGTTLLALGTAAAIAAVAQVAIPTTPVPTTLQTAVLFFAAAALGPTVGGLAAACYLLAAALGLPVLADGAHFAATGLWQAKTAGYVLAFVPAAILLGRCTQRRPHLGGAPLFAAVLVAHVAVLVVGWAWLGRQIGWAAAWQHGVTPFWLGAAAKSALVAGLLAGLRRLRHRPAR